MCRKVDNYTNLELMFFVVLEVVKFKNDLLEIPSAIVTPSHNTYMREYFRDT